MTTTLIVWFVFALLFTITKWMHWKRSAKLWEMTARQNDKALNHTIKAFTKHNQEHHPAECGCNQLSEEILRLIKEQ